MRELIVLAACTAALLTPAPVPAQQLSAAEAADILVVALMYGVRHHVPPGDHSPSALALESSGAVEAILDTARSRRVTRDVAKRLAIEARSTDELMSCSANEAGGTDCTLAGPGMAASALIESFGAGVATVTVSFLTGGDRTPATRASLMIEWRDSRWTVTNDDGVPVR